MAKNFFGITDTGRLRHNNEDTFIAQAVLNNKYIAACVIDGVGGYSGGEVAAKLAQEAILETLRSTPGDLLTLMRQGLATANERIYNEKQRNKENDQMACVLTLALVDVADNKFYYAHVGDTRLYLLRDSSLVKVTRDHSFVGFLEDSGRLNEEAAMKHPKRNEINKALGFDTNINGQADYIETGDSPFLPGDMLLLCSDGLSDMIGNSTITSILTSNKSLSAKGKALIQAANDAGGKDNITVVIVENNKPRPQHEATRPMASMQKKNDTEAPREIVEDKVHSKPIIIEKTNRRNSKAVPVLLFLCLLFLGAFSWMVYKEFLKKGDPQPLTTNTLQLTKRNEQEQRLLDSISDPARKEVFIMNLQGGQPIVITDTLSINKDTLHIIGNGATLTSDTTYKGAAFSVSPASRYILLDSMTLQNFDVGVLVNNKALHFKNVQFKNCRVPVQYQVPLLANALLSGRFADTIFYHSDTLHKGY